jgi:hypothetical protein
LVLYFTLTPGPETAIALFRLFVRFDFDPSRVGLPRVCRNQIPIGMKTDRAA